MRNLRTLLLLLGLFSGAHDTIAQSVGLVLSGGGVKSMAHIGVLRALEEEGIRIDYIVGTSGGALVGAMYAAGYSPGEIEQIITSPEFIRSASGEQDESSGYFYLLGDPDASIASVNLRIDSTLHTRIPSNIVNTAEIDFGLMQQFAAASFTIGNNFDSLMIPFRCLSADITAKKAVVFRSGDLAQAVRASMAYPFYFPPVLIDDHLHYDGGIFDNFPQRTMLAEFNPDILIGVNTADETETPADGNFLSQLKSMIQQAQDFDKIRENDILIKPEFSAISTLDFNAAKTAIDSGYQAALRCMSAIKQKTSNRTDIETIKQARRRFRGQPDSINVRTIASTGLTQEQSDYVNASLNPFHRNLSIQQLKRNWHRLTRDQNFEYIYPILRTTEKSDSTALLIQARSNRGLDIDFGGIVSSRPVNTGFVSARHRFWAQQSLTIHGNLYFGKLYNSALLGMRLDIPGRLPLQVEPFAIISRYDFYKSSSTFFSDLKPSFLIQQEQLYGMTLATPLRNAGKLSIAIQSFNRKDKYYLTRIFSEADTSDLTKLTGFAVSLNAQRNTLNRKMYPNKGQLLRLDLRGFLADELTIPGSTGIITDSTSAIHRWLQLNARIDQYIAYRSWLRFGYLAEFQFSGMPFLSNQSATASLAPAFQPITEMQTLYLSPFRAHNYLGAGARCIFLLNEDLDVRTEAYVFQPFQEILATQDLKATYGDPFSKRYFAASVNTVYQSPAGPISLAVNYINGREKPLSIMFHLGYLLFNRRIFQD